MPDTVAVSLVRSCQIRSSLPHVSRALGHRFHQFSQLLDSALDLARQQPTSQASWRTARSSLPGGRRTMSAFQRVATDR